MQSQVLYVIPVTSILGRLALVPVGDTGTIPFSMRKETCNFPGASCDSKKDAGLLQTVVFINCWWKVFKVSFTFQTNLWHLVYLSHLFYLARIEDNDPGFERGNWMKRTKQSEPEEALQADRWYKKNTDEERDNPEQSGLYLIIYITYCVYCTYTTYESKITYDT